MKKKNIILGNIETSVADLMYFDQHEDKGEIDNAVRDDEISLDEIVGKFKECLVELFMASGAIEKPSEIGK